MKKIPLTQGKFALVECYEGEDDIEVLMSVDIILKIYKIALSALTDTENGFAMCPREPSDDMYKGFRDSFLPLNEWKNKRKKFRNFKAAISARPQSALDKILNTTKEK